MVPRPNFTCPICGSHCFGSSDNGDGTRTYNCQEGPRGPCLFSVHEKSAARYGIVSPPQQVVRSGRVA